VVKSVPLGKFPDDALGNHSGPDSGKIHLFIDAWRNLRHIFNSNQIRRWLKVTTIVKMQLIIYNNHTNGSVYLQQVSTPKNTVPIPSGKSEMDFDLGSSSWLIKSTSTNLSAGIVIATAADNSERAVINCYHRADAAAPTILNVYTVSMLPSTYAMFAVGFVFAVVARATIWLLGKRVSHAARAISNGL